MMTNSVKASALAARHSLDIDSNISNTADRHIKDYSSTTASNNNVTNKICSTLQSLRNKRYNKIKVRHLLVFVLTFLTMWSWITNINTGTTVRTKTLKRVSLRVYSNTTLERKADKLLEDKTEGWSEDKVDGWADVKLAIYMTTHLSESHLTFLPCWHHAIRHLRIFRYADLILYISTEPPPEVLDQLPFRNVVVKRYENRGYQEGAIKAMTDPFMNKTDLWFREYDWVIRVNPDVLIRNDTWLIKTMLNTSIDAIVHECRNRKAYPPDTGGDDGKVLKFHTDFTAFRPSAIDHALVLTASTIDIDTKDKFNAENHYTNAIRNIYNSSRFAYLEGANNSVPGWCRVEGMHSPVIHVHEVNKFCPEYYNATNKTTY